MRKALMKQVVHWAALLVLALPALSQAQSMEERLRTQLRNTAQQLQQVQSQQAQLNAAKAAAETERDAAQRELVSLRKEVETLRARSSKLEGDQESVRRQAQAQVASSRQQAAQVQTAYQTLERQATALHSEATSLKAQLEERNGEYLACVGKNQEMYQAGRELLTAYEAFGTGDLLAVRQPFSGRARVLFDEKAQEFGDRLYSSQVEAILQPEQESASK